MKPELIDFREAIDVEGLARWSRIYYKLNGNVLPDGYSQFMNMRDLDLRQFYRTLGDYFNVAVSPRSWSVLAGRNGAALSFQNDRLYEVVVALDAEQPLHVDVDGYPLEVPKGWGVIVPPKARARFLPYSGQRVTFAKYAMILQRSRAATQRRSTGTPQQGGYLTHAFVATNERKALLEQLESLTGDDAIVTPGTPVVDDLFERLRARFHEASSAKLVDQCFGHMVYRRTPAGKAWQRKGAASDTEGMVASILLEPAAEGGIIRPAGFELRQMPGSCVFWLPGFYADVTEVTAGERKELIAIAAVGGKPNGKRRA